MCITLVIYVHRNSHNPIAGEKGLTFIKVTIKISLGLIDTFSTVIIRNIFPATPFL